MGIAISIISDHNLTFNNVHELKNILEVRLESEINFSIKGKPVLKSKLNFPSNYYFYPYEFAEEMFRRHSVYYLTTNSELCELIWISKGSIKFAFPYNVNHKFNTWYNIISECYESDKELRIYKDIYSDQKDSWNKFLRYLEETAKKVGATKILFLNDSSYEHIEYELTLENEFNNFLKSIKSSEIFKYEEIDGSKKKIVDTNICLIKELKTS